MPRTRKVFAAHGGEIANKFLNAVERDGLVARFVDSYVAEFDRRSLKTSQAQYRELLSMIGREVLLVMVARARATLPVYLHQSRQRARHPESEGEAPAAEGLVRELIASLARALDWSAEDEEEFRRDLGLYSRLGSRAPHPKRRTLQGAAEGPFADRCALLLDPSMLDKARMAAGNFFLEIERRTDKILSGVLRRR